MSTLRSRATRHSRRGFWARLFTPSTRRVLRRALPQLRSGDTEAFASFDVLAADRRALAFLSAAELLDEDGHLDMAWQAARHATELDFTSTTACVLFAALSARLNRTSEGIAACRRLLAQTPGQVPVVGALANLLTRSGDPKAALGALAGAGYEELPLFMLREAQALYALEQNDEARTLVAKVVVAADGPEDPLGIEAARLLARLK